MFDAKFEFNKNIYFDADAYLQNKTEALNAYAERGRSDWTVTSTLEAIQEAGMTAWEHFARYGAFERAADGGYGINPSKYFDLDRYYTEKTVQYNKTEHADYSVEDMVGIFRGFNLDPINHYSRYGYQEFLTPRLEDLETKWYDPKKWVPSSGDYKVDSLLSNIRAKDWNNLSLIQDNTLYFSFPSTPPYGYFDDEDIAYFDEFNDNQKAGVHQALNYINSITGIHFVFTENDAEANLMFHEWYSSDNVTAHAVPGKHSGLYGIAFTNPEIKPDPYGNRDDLRFGETYGYTTLLHEIGHALGLKHPHDTSSGAGIVLSKLEDNRLYSVMSYTMPRDVPGSEWYHATDANYYYSPYDIMAFNYLYGTDGLYGTEGLASINRFYGSAEASAGDLVYEQGLQDTYLQVEVEAVGIPEYVDCVEVLPSV